MLQEAAAILRALLASRIEGSCLKGIAAPIMLQAWVWNRARLLGGLFLGGFFEVRGRGLLYLAIISNKRKSGAVGTTLQDEGSLEPWGKFTPRASGSKCCRSRSENDGLGATKMKSRGGGGGGRLVAPTAATCLVAQGIRATAFQTKFVLGLFFVGMDENFAEVRRMKYVGQKRCRRKFCCFLEEKTR